MRLDLHTHIHTGLKEGGTNLCTWLCVCCFSLSQLWNHFTCVSIESNAANINTTELHLPLMQLHWAVCCASLLLISILWLQEPKNPERGQRSWLCLAALLRSVHVINHHCNWCSLERCNRPSCLLYSTCINLSESFYMICLCERQVK